MTRYKSYIAAIKSRLSSPAIKSIGKTVKDASTEYISNFDFCSQKSGLLLGNVQSGKTGHMLGILAHAADNNFEFFIILTAGMSDLQEQTYERALDLESAFCICDEGDDIRFRRNNMVRPVILVLKKNYKVLGKWKEHIESSQFARGRSLFIIDDEADAASLNTKINQQDVSTINQRITDIKDLFNSSFYLQVTATPQSLLLQSLETTYKPEFVRYFEPGKSYIGGNFFYREDANMLPFVKFTEENELLDLLDDSAHIPKGLQEAIFSFLIAAADINLTKSRDSCNFLIHPSVSTSDHDTTARKVGEALNILLQSMRENDLNNLLKDAWDDLKLSKTNISRFNDCIDYISNALENEEVKTSVINSKSKCDSDFSKGINIIIGGNSLGRGITIPNLQTTYYCRKSKRNQADTTWQHSRAFGYDRDPDLVRMFLPPTLFHLFSEINASNNAIIEYAREKGLEGLELQYSGKIKPTRNNIIDRSKLLIVAGGRNTFPIDPKNKTNKDLEKLLLDFDDKEKYHSVDINLILSILKHCDSGSGGSWNNEKFINCINSLDAKYKKKAILIVRRNRNIRKGSGTLLSQDDRELGDKFEDKVTLTMYRVSGEGKWNGKLVWIPNIKLPKKVFYSTIG